MALVPLAPSVTFSFVDESGSPGKMQLNVGAAATLAATRTAADALVPLIEAATDCAVIGYSISASTIQTPAGAPEAGSRVERKANFSFRTAAGKTSSFTLPGVKDAAVLASGRVDEDEASIAALLTAIQDGIWTDSNGSDLTNVITAYETFRTTRKRQLPSNRRPDANATAGDDGGLGV